MLVSTQYTAEKYNDLHDVQADILDLVYHHPRQLGFQD